MESFQKRLQTWVSTCIERIENQLQSLESSSANVRRWSRKINEIALSTRNKISEFLSRNHDDDISSQLKTYEQTLKIVSLIDTLRMIDQSLINDYFSIRNRWKNFTLKT